MTEALIGFAAVLALVLLRMPIAFAMGLVGMLGYAHLNSSRGAISMVGRLIIDTSQNYGLSVVPLFILMGLFVNKGGLSRELYALSFAFLGHLRGGLAMATIAACAGFSAICGSKLLSHLPNYCHTYQSAAPDKTKFEAKKCIYIQTNYLHPKYYKTTKL